MNADSLARHVASALGHLAGVVHGCERCLRRGYFRRDGLDRHLRDCRRAEAERRGDVGGRGDGSACSAFEERADLKAGYYRQDVVHRARD